MLSNTISPGIQDAPFGSKHTVTDNENKENKECMNAQPCTINTINGKAEKDREKVTQPKSGANILRKMPTYQLRMWRAIWILSKLRISKQLSVSKALGRMQRIAAHQSATSREQEADKIVYKMSHISKVMIGVSILQQIAKCRTRIMMFKCFQQWVPSKQPSNLKYKLKNLIILHYSKYLQQLQRGLCRLMMNTKVCIQKPIKPSNDLAAIEEVICQKCKCSLEESQSITNSAIKSAFPEEEELESLRQRNSEMEIKLKGAQAQLSKYRSEIEEQVDCSLKTEEERLLLMKENKRLKEQIASHDVKIKPVNHESEEIGSFDINERVEKVNQETNTSDNEQEAGSQQFELASKLTAKKDNKLTKKPKDEESKLMKHDKWANSDALAMELVNINKENNN